MEQKITIAIDGHSSCGKSTMAKQLAGRLGYIYIDTGAMYRAVTLYALRHGLVGNGAVKEQELKQEMERIHISFRYNEETGRPDTYLNDERVEDEIRGMEVSGEVSHVAALAFVREAMVDRQREMGKEKGVVMDGRDIGTVVFPDAELKVFVTASPEIRAERRYKELTEKGASCSMEEILKNVRERDHIDSTRAISPLRPAEDAIILDNSHMSREEQLDWLTEKANETIARNIRA